VPRAETSSGGAREFAVESGKQALAPGVVAGIADRADRGWHAGWLAALGDSERGILAARVGMMDHLPWPALSQGQVAGVENQRGASAGGPRPADDPAAPDIPAERPIEEPARVGTSVMSATDSWLGPAAGTSRSTRSGAGRACLSRGVVTGPPRRRLAPTTPAARLSRALRLRPCRSPAACRSAGTRGARQVCRARIGTLLIRASSPASARTRAQGGR